jgi:hypothetical protein
MEWFVHRQAKGPVSRDNTDARNCDQKDAQKQTVFFQESYRGSFARDGLPLAGRVRQRF